MSTQPLSDILFTAACTRATQVVKGQELNVDLADLSKTEQPRLAMALSAAQLSQATFDSLAVLHARPIQFVLLIDTTAAKLSAATITALGTLDLRIFAIDDATHSWREVRDGSPMPLHTHLWCLPSAIALTMSVMLHSSGLGGAERSHVEYVRDLVSTGVLIHTIIPEPGGTLAQMLRDAGSSVTILPFAMWWCPHPRALDSPETVLAHQQAYSQELIPRARIEVIDALRPDIVMTRTLVIPHGAFAAAALGIPHVWDISEFGDRDHGLTMPFAASQMGQIFDLLSDGVTFHSQSLREYFLPLTSQSSGGKVRVISTAPRISQTEIHEFEESKIRHSKERDAFSPFVVGIVAGLQEGKGHADAIEAAALLKQQHKRVEFRFIGPGTDFDIDRLTRLIAHNRVSDCVHLVGFKPTMDQVYEGLDAVAVTSRSEGLGRVAFEATELSLPVIFAQSAGLIDYMSSNYGLPYMPGDPIALVAAIDHLMEDPELGTRLVANARAKFQSDRMDPMRVQNIHDWLIQVRTNYAPPPLRQIIGSIVAAGADMTPQNEHGAVLKRSEQLVGELRNALGIAVSRQEHIDEISRQLAGAREVIQAMQASRSWRWTRPLRRRS
ncbi:MAG: glycosyltransferase [Actinobacteria bacterium]|uniref:Unannotated protein n=1 Tax=freshwater metagenome TaxID=449393 RepID=A0A6J5YYR2_9ZZZZ|nr:glycosyltransferase [Actinomycetota bacterium]